jgi:hypothetical protein
VATALINSLPSPQFVHNLTKKQPVVPIKVAFFGEQGTGKTTSAALLAAALSKEYHNGAPVWVTDPELGWQFPKRRIFTPEGIELVQRTVPTYKAMMEDLRDAEQAGACAYVVELQKIWIELLATVRKECGNNWGNQLNSLWTAWVNRFLNSRLHCMALGRVGDVTDEILDDDGKLLKIKTGEKMKAGGSQSFGYEPHLVIRMKSEIKPARRKGQVIDGEGRILHCGYVLKDRTWELNGKILRWSDKDGYKPGGYRQVWESIRPHFNEVQATMGFVTLDTSANSSSVIDDDGNSEFYQARQRKEAIAGEIKACMDLFFGGRGKDDVQVRIAISDLIFGVKSKEAADALPIEKLERGLRILQGFERNVAPPVGMPSSKEEILITISEAIKEYDSGQTKMQELPF